MGKHHTWTEDQIRYIKRIAKGNKKKIIQHIKNAVILTYFRIFLFCINEFNAQKGFAIQNLRNQNTFSALALFGQVKALCKLFQRQNVGHDGGEVDTLLQQAADLLPVFIHSPACNAPDGAAAIAEIGDADGNRLVRKRHAGELAFRTEILHGSGEPGHAAGEVHRHMGAVAVGEGVEKVN